jgi:hypothetical protein
VVGLAVVRTRPSDGQALPEAGSAPRGAGQQKENNQSNQEEIYKTMNINEPMSIREIELRRKEIATQQAIDIREVEWCKQNGRYAEHLDHARHQLVMSMRAYIFGKDHPKREVVIYPETWWDAVTDRFAPTWFRSRFPVKYTKVTASLEEVYPDIRPAIPDKHAVLMFTVQTHNQYLKQ